MFTERTSVGLDVHARSVVGAAIDTVTGQIVRARLSPFESFVEVLSWLFGLPGPVAVVYEAGPTGYGLARVLRGHGLRCEVAAPSRLPRQPGDKRKTDQRDALKLANALRADQVVGVEVPSEACEDARDLVRTAEDARIELMAARFRCSALLLRHGRVYHGGSTWTAAHERWLRAQRTELSGPGTRAAFEDYFETVIAQTVRKDRLRGQVLAMAADSEFTEVTHRLACIRGITDFTGFALAVEVGEWNRFSGRSIGAFLGLAPGESSSGESTRRTSITRDGNTHARRLLTEAAWHQHATYRPGIVLRRRWSRVDPVVAARADKVSRRLAYRRSSLLARGKEPSVVNIAIARELAGSCWGLATLDLSSDGQDFRA